MRLGSFRQPEEHVDAQTADVVGLAWARGLRLDDDAAFSRAGGRCVVPDEGLAGLEFVELFGAAALRGPRALVEAVAQLPSRAFYDGTAVAALAEADRGRDGDGGRRGMRTAARERLAYRDHYGAPTPGGPLTQGPLADGAPAPGGVSPAGAQDPAVPLISRAPHDAALVLEAAPADDAADLARELRKPTGPEPLARPPGPSGPPCPDAGAELFTLIDGEARVAVAGFTTVHHLLADLHVITASARRRCGHGRTVAGIAVGEALDAGLVCQARMRAESTAAAALAADLGFTAVGGRVVITPGPAPDDDGTP